MSGTLSQGPSGGGIVPQGFAPANPQAAMMAQRFQGMSTEQMQEMAARAGASQQGQMAQRALMQRHFMPNAQPQASSGGITAQQPGTSTQPGTGIAQTPQATAAGVALPPTTNAMQRGGGIVRRQHFDMGGMPSSQEDPWWTRSEAHSESGLIHAYTPGRTDTINMEPLAESHIIPADVISGLGEGNTLAGAAVMDRIVNSAPFGTQMPRGSHGRGPPAPPHVSSRQFESRGGQPVGKLGQRVPIIAAGGEYKVSPEQVLRLGRGSYKRGHDLLDAFILEVRKRTIKDMKNLPGPKK